MKNTFIRLNSFLLMVIMGLQANVLILNAIADDFNSIFTKKTVTERVDAGCSGVYYIKKVVEEKQSVTTGNDKEDKNSQKDVIRESIKIFKYLTAEPDSENADCPDICTFPCIEFNVTKNHLIEIDHPPELRLA